MSQHLAMLLDLRALTTAPPDAGGSRLLRAAALASAATLALWSSCLSGRAAVYSSWEFWVAILLGALAVAVTLTPARPSDKPKAAIIAHPQAQGEQLVEIMPILFSSKAFFNSRLSRNATLFKIISKSKSGELKTHLYANDAFAFMLFRRNGLKHYSNGAWCDVP